MRRRLFFDARILCGENCTTYTLSLFKYIKDYFADTFVCATLNVIWKKDFISVRQRLITTILMLWAYVSLSTISFSFLLCLCIRNTALTNYFIQQNIGKKMPSGTLGLWNKTFIKYEHCIYILHTLNAVNYLITFCCSTYITWPHFLLCKLKRSNFFECEIIIT